MIECHCAGIEHMLRTRSYASATFVLRLYTVNYDGIRVK